MQITTLQQHGLSNLKELEGLEVDETAAEVDLARYRAESRTKIDQLQAFWKKIKQSK